MRDSPLFRQTDNPKPSNPASRPLPTELTGEMFDAYCKVVEMIFAVRLSLFQKARVKPILQEYFHRDNVKGMRSVQQAVETYDDLMKRDAVERVIRARKKLPHAIEELHKNVDGLEQEAKWLLSVYHNAYATVAPGNPSLTRDVADAWIGMDHFLRSQIWPQKVPPSLRLSRALYDRKLSARWKIFPAKKRYRFMFLPGELIQLKCEWAQIGPIARRELQHKVLYDEDNRDVLLEAVPDPAKQK